RAPVLRRRAQRRQVDQRGTRLLLDLRQIVDVADDRGRVVRVAQRIDVGVGQTQGRDAEDLRGGGLVHVAGVEEVLELVGVVVGRVVLAAGARVARLQR